MKNVTMSKNLMCVGLVLALTGCGGGKSSSSSSSANSRLSLKAVSGSSASAFGMAKVQAQSSDAIPILFPQLSATGYYYRPGVDPSTQLGNDMDGIDWTTYAPDWSQWQIVGMGPNVTGFGDFVLPSGGVVDIGNITSKNPAVTDNFNRTLTVNTTGTQNFMKNVGVFSFDLIYVTARNPALVNANGDVCGGQGYLTSGSFSDFPNLNFTTPCIYRDIQSGYDNSTNFNMLFARSDWFSAPVQVYPYYYTGLSPGDAAYPQLGQMACWKADVALSSFQQEVIDSWMIARNAGGTDDATKGTWGTAGKYRSDCDTWIQTQGVPAGQVTYPLSIVPQPNQVPVVQFTNNSDVAQTGDTPNGNTVPQTTQNVMGQSVELVIGFDVTPSLIADYASFNDSNAAPSTPVVINRTSDGMPWGLSLSLRAVTPAVLPANQ